MKQLEFNLITPKPRITKDFILSKINQESIIQYYTKIDVTSKKLHLSPFRNDNKVTVGLYKSKNGIVYLHDFATNEHINCFEVVMKLYDCNYYEALDIIAQDFELVESNSSVKEVSQKNKPILIDEISETHSSDIKVQIKDFTEDELKWWEQFGISKKLLKKYHVYSIKYVFLNGNLKFTSSNKCPIYGYYFGKDKNKDEKWKLYFPMNKDKGIRFLNNLPNKKLQGYKQLDKTGDILIITKSLKDCACFRAFNINAVAPSSESTFCLKEQIDEFKKRFKHIIVMYDQDKAGKHNMYKIRLKYPELDFFVIPNYLKAKDFSDLRKLYGKEKTKELLNQCLKYFKNKWQKD